LPTGLEDMLRDEEASGELDFDVPPISEVCALDLCKEAFAELLADPVTRAEYERTLPLVERLGY
jgi:hypothetical protein